MILAGESQRGKSLAVEAGESADGPPDVPRLPSYCFRVENEGRRLKSLQRYESGGVQSTALPLGEYLSVVGLRHILAPPR